MFGISISGIWNGLTAFFGFGEQVAKNVNDANQQDAGKAEEKAAAQDAVLADAKEARDVQNSVDALPDGGVDQLRAKWTRKS